MSFTFMNLDFEVVVFIPMCARISAKYDESQVRGQMIKVLARPTNNAEKFCGQPTNSKKNLQNKSIF